ncbi:MAG: ExbD/TolR family protein [Gammaproteobacteria bacterium]
MALHLLELGGAVEEAGSDLHPMAEINVTPFVDVMLVLLIVFMVTAPLMVLQVPVELPKVSAEPMEKPPAPIVVVLNRQNRIFIDRAEISEGEFFGRLKDLKTRRPDAAVYVGADEGVPYGNVLKLLSAAGAAGFAQVSLLSEDAAQ